MLGIATLNGADCIQQFVVLAGFNIETRRYWSLASRNKSGVSCLLQYVRVAQLHGNLIDRWSFQVKSGHTESRTESEGPASLTHYVCHGWFER